MAVSDRDCITADDIVNLTHQTTSNISGYAACGVTISDCCIVSQGISSQGISD